MKQKKIILIIEDDIGQQDALNSLFKDEYTVLLAETGNTGIEIIKKQQVDLVILDIILPDISGVEVLKIIKESSPDIDVIMVTADTVIKTAIDCIKLGAYDYITKPYDIDELLSIVSKIFSAQTLIKEVTYLRSECDRSVGLENIIGIEENMHQIFDIIKEMSNSDSTVMIHGESGTGKELIAKAIHYTGIRKDGPFVAVDCAAIPDSLLESEFFGYEKGAFTDAVARKIGKFELANNGTLFLDEISNLKPDFQAKFLRVIQEREFQRIGGTKNIKVDIRIICATNTDLKKLVDQNLFRNDLYYRLNVIPILVPPLRERGKDIPVLINYFINMYNKKFNKKVQKMSDTANVFLCSYKWPGNIRELKNVIERLVALNKNTIISHKQLPIEILIEQESKLNIDEKQMLTLKATTNQFEKQFLVSILEKVKWNQCKAARMLSVHRNTMLMKIQKLGIVNERLTQKKQKS